MQRRDNSEPDHAARSSALLETSGRSMSADITRVSAKVRDAEIAPEAWPEALRSLTDALGAGGAACIIANKKTKGADWVCFSGLSEGFDSRYIERYARLDPYIPFLNVSSRWITLSECLPQPLLRRSEWYNDFVLSCGVSDMLGIRLVETPSHCVYVGIHQQIGRRFRFGIRSRLEELGTFFKSAVLRQVERTFGATDGSPDTKEFSGGTRYYFHVRNGAQYLDDTREPFVTREEAVARASVLAAELAKEGDWSGCAIAVTDEAGTEIACVPVCL